MKRGEIRWYEFEPPDKRRPVLILTRDSVIPYLNQITVAPITSAIRGIPSELALGIEDGMPQDCAVNFDHLQTVAKRKVGRLIATLTEKKLTQIGPAICFALGLNEYLDLE
jgi:mRNA interferase MazF